LAQAKALLANAIAVQGRTQLDVERYGPLAKEQAASQQDLGNEPRKIEVNPPPFRRSLATLDLRLGGRTVASGQIILNLHCQILLARCLFFGQRAVTLYVELRSALHRYGMASNALGLRQLTFRRSSAA